VDLTAIKGYGQRSLERAGWVLQRFPAVGTLQRQLRTLFTVLDVTCVIDVGANGGQYARMLRDEIGFSGRIASVEPASEPFRDLTRTMAGDEEWAGFNFALGAEEGEATLHVAPLSVFNSLHTLNTYGTERFSQREVGTEVIGVRRLEQVFDELAAGHDRVFLKCDTQGHDLAVLEGLGNREVLGVQVELSFIPIYDEMPGATEVIEALAARGQFPVGFFAVTRASDQLRLIEADGIFARDLTRPSTQLD
jgi:FkbM family methyltransferase